MGVMTVDGSRDAARATLRRLLAAQPGVELRPMFGTLAALVDGHVFAVAIEGRIGVKLDPASLEELADIPGSDIVEMGGRRMRAYRSLPEQLPDEEQASWLERARSHVAAQHG